MNGKLLPLGAALLCCAAQTQAQGTDRIGAGDWLVRVGFHDIDPKSGNLSLGPNSELQVRDDTSLTFNVSYFFTDALAIELQAATPFEHDVDLQGVGKVASTEHLPPTLNLQYHFPLGDFKPYVGAGVNWTLFFNESTVGDLSGSKLELDDSFGLGVQAGTDYSIGNGWYLNGEVRWLDIDSDLKLDGVELGTVEIDPFVFALTVGKRF